MFSLDIPSKSDFRFKINIKSLSKYRFFFHISWFYIFPIQSKYSAHINPLDWQDSIYWLKFYFFPSYKNFHFLRSSKTWFLCRIIFLIRSDSCKPLKKFEWKNKIFFDWNENMASKSIKEESSNCNVKWLDKVQVT